MYISLYKQLIDFRNCFGVLYRLCHGEGQRTCSHFKRLHW